ncbi:MAG TPA: DNA mismatch endonuclease Vsr [Verrucomicrobiae bacterium]|nr:DNA mismatch endonuclease Vsr [Verrucomicrobiae bacterium]
MNWLVNCECSNKAIRTVRKNQLDSAKTSGRLDPLSRQERGRRMSLIRGKDTKPELFVRSLIHRMGFRFVLHKAGLPGRPDICFPSRKKIIFIHGCFWHRHSDPKCKMARLPKSRLEFWRPKLENNAERDKRHLLELRKAGWRCLIVWECQLAKVEKMQNRIRRFLTP